MKFAILFSLLVFSVAGFAKDIQPKSIGVQYLENSIQGKPFVNFMITVNAADFPTAKFSALEAVIVDANDASKIILSGFQVYTKNPATTIVGSEVLAFSYEGDVASALIKHMKTSKILFITDVGQSFSVNLAELCTNQPENFMNLMGKSGCK